MTRVLHIEDDASNRLLVSKVLTRAGYEVVDACTGIEGVQLADQVSPDIVLIDINVPDLDGYEVILRLRGLDRKGYPIVAVTADGDRDLALSVGADGFIRKPLDINRLPQALEGYISGARDTSGGSPDGHLKELTYRIVGRLERKVRELSEAKARLENMAELRYAFLRNVSHELATPMTPVVGYLRLLLAEELGPLTPLQRKSLESVQSSTHRLRKVIDKLLDVSSLETGAMHFYAREYSFLSVVKTAVADSAPRFREQNIQVHESYEDFDDRALGDEDKLKRALIHVLDNAGKFSAKGGEVGVEVKNENGRFGVFVADSGPGVRGEDLQRILEPLYQADGSVTRTHGGVGLGLAFAKDVADAMMGELELESPPKGPVAGRTFTGTVVRLFISPFPQTRSDFTP